MSNYNRKESSYEVSYNNNNSSVIVFTLKIKMKHINKFNLIKKKYIDNKFVEDSDSQKKKCPPPVNSANWMQDFDTLSEGCHHF